MEMIFVVAGSFALGMFLFVWISTRLNNKKNLE